MKFNTKLSILSLALLSTLHTFTINAMNQDPNKGLSIEDQLKARRSQLQQNDAQRQAAAQQAEQAVQNQCDFINAINREIKHLINGLHDAQTYDAIFTLLGDMIAELQRPYENISIVDMHASGNTMITQALTELHARMEEIILAVQQSTPLQSYILESKRLQQFDIQLQHIAKILNYAHTGSLIEIEMDVDQDENLAEILQKEELQFEGLNNNNNNIIHDDEIIMTEKTSNNVIKKNYKKRKFEHTNTQSDKKKKLDNLNFNAFLDSIDLFATPTYPNKGSSVASLSQNRYNDIWLMAREGKIKTVEMLLKQDPTLLNKKSCNVTPLACAVSNNKIDMVDFLLKQGANTEITNSFEQTPFITAVICHFRKVAERLIAHGAHVNHQDDEGNTALHHAARDNNIKLVELLLANKAKINLKNKAGLSPLDLALQAIHDEKRAVAIAILLLQHEAKPSLSNWVGIWNNHCSNIN